jgi:hypothetical protein
MVASVQQVGPTGQSASADFSKMPVTEIEVVARTANPQFPNGLHAYIDITRVDEGQVHHQYIAADPVGGTPFTHEGGQLTFIEGRENPAVGLMHSARLHAPPEMSLTEYANAIVDGAKAYNEHPVRYDGLGERGYNSNSFVSSLLIAKGGLTAVHDLDAMIAGGMDTPGPLRTNANDHSVTNAMAADLTERDSNRGRNVVPGLDHASIDPGRFRARSSIAAEPVPKVPQVGDLTDSFGAFVNKEKHTFAYQIQKAMADRGWSKEPVGDPTFPPADRAHGIRVRMDGNETIVGAGYHQAGTIVKVDERSNTLTQRTDRGDVSYNLAEIRNGMGDPPNFDKLVAAGKRLEIAITPSESVNVTPVLARQQERSHDLGLGR